jgi:hypothetical protein
MKSTSHLSENHQSETRPDVCLYEQASEFFLEFLKEDISYNGCPEKRVHTSTGCGDAKF